MGTKWHQTINDKMTFNIHKINKSSSSALVQRLIDLQRFLAMAIDLQRFLAMVILVEVRNDPASPWRSLAVFSCFGGFQPPLTSWRDVIQLPPL